MAFLFTVCTPTYNRAHTLSRVYESLRSQTFRDFEWVVVDDGSTDGTSELVRKWKADHRTWFPIRYFWQENQHKKVAVNRGVREARGELFLVADSDDWFPPNALETFAEHWRLIPDGEREQFAGVCGLCVYENGRVVGDRFPGGDWIDSNLMEICYRYRVRGEKWGFVRTDILRHVRFPEHILGHVPESVVWNRIGARYKTRYINEVVRVYVQETGEKVTQLTRMRDPAKVAPGMVYWKRMILSDEISWFWYAPVSFFLDAARLVRFRLHLRCRPREFWPTSRLGRTLVVMMIPAGVLWWLYDLWRTR